MKKTLLALTLAASAILTSVALTPRSLAAGLEIPDFDALGESAVITEDFQDYRPYQTPNFPTEVTDSGVAELEGGDKGYFVHGTRPTMVSTIPTYTVNVEPSGNQYLTWSYGTTLYRESRLHMNLGDAEKTRLKQTAYVMEISLKKGEHFGGFSEYFKIFDNRDSGGSSWCMLGVDNAGRIWQGDLRSVGSNYDISDGKLVGEISDDMWTRITIKVTSGGSATVYIDGDQTDGAAVSGAASPSRITPISMKSTMNKAIDICIDDCAVYLGTSPCDTKPMEYETPEPYIIGANLTLGSDIALNFYVPEGPVSGLDNLKVIGTVCKETQELRYKGNKYVDGTDCRIYTYEHIPPHMMSENITVKISADGCRGSTLTYGVGKYFHNILDGESSKTYSNAESRKLQAMCVEALDYGALMQGLKNYKTHELVNHGIMVRERDNIRKDDPEIKNDSRLLNNGAGGIEWYGAALDVSGTIGLKFYFSSEAEPSEDATVECMGVDPFTVSRESFERVTVDGKELYCITVKVKNILCLYGDITVRIGDSEITYGITDCDDEAYRDITVALSRYVISVRDYAVAAAKK